METLESTLAPLFVGRPRDVTEENLQARARGLVLMALSNKFGELLVTTGNKSEMSVGYATLYGDMCGGYSVLKDVYKTEVYALSRWRNQEVPDGGMGPGGQVIPTSSITKAPTAELRPNQTDQDSLPPYEELDAILGGLVEDEQSVDRIVARGFAREVVTRVQRLLYAARCQTKTSAAGCQDKTQELRTRPPLPHHKRVSRTVAVSTMRSLWARWNSGCADAAGRPRHRTQGDIRVFDWEQRTLRSNHPRPVSAPCSRRTTRG